MTTKISIISYESAVGRTSLALGLFSHSITIPGSRIHLLGYDVEKPDLIQVFEKIKFTADQVFAGFPKIDNLRCKYCGACANYCDLGAIRLDRHKPAIEIIADTCEACGKCIEGCGIHGISTKERFTGYLLQGRMDNHTITIGNADNSHDYLVPLICAMNHRINPDVMAICDLGPGNSGYVRTALKGTSMAILVLKPSRGWKRNMQYLQGMLKESHIPFGIVINKYRNENGFLEEVKAFCDRLNISLLGILPYNLKSTPENSFSIHAMDSENAAIFAAIWDKVTHQKLH